MVQYPFQMLLSRIHSFPNTGRRTPKRRKKGLPPRSKKVESKSDPFSGYFPPPKIWQLWLDLYHEVANYCLSSTAWISEWNRKQQIFQPCQVSLSKIWCKYMEPEVHFWKLSSCTLKICLWCVRCFIGCRWESCDLPWLVNCIIILFCDETFCVNIRSHGDFYVLWNRPF